MAKTTEDAPEMNAITKKLLPSIAATTGFLLSVGIDPAFAKGELPPDTSYVGKDFTAAFLPAIMVPLVGLVFPAFSMALFFLYSQQDDIESA
jgi:photosystem I subunit 8